MAKTEKAVMTIRYIDGTEQRFEFTRGDKFNTANRFRESLSAGQVIVGMKDRVFVIPFSSIRSIEVSPPPETLPSHAINNARIISE